VAVRLGDDRRVRHRLLQRLAFSEMHHNRDIFPTNTIAYDTLNVILLRARIAHPNSALVAYKNSFSLWRGLKTFLQK